MKIHSTLPYKTYLLEMKRNLENVFWFGTARITGLVLGCFFSITYHAGYEWGRRYSNEKQRAIGIVRRDGEGTKVYCIRLAGMTNPISLIGVYLFCLWIYYIKDGVAFALGDGLWLSLIVTTIVAGTTAFFNSVTEQGQEAYNIVSAYLIDPSDYWSLLR